MDETTRGIIERIRVVCDKPVLLPDGQECKVFYDCARLSPNDLSRLAAEATGDVEEHVFDMVVGVAYAGILFAASIAGGRSVSILQADGQLWGGSVRGRKVLIVDDVIFSGARVQRAAKRVADLGGSVVGYACIVDRSDGKLGAPLWSAYEARVE